MKIKNIAIIAHVDHGKTTLVDALLTQSGLFRENEETEKRMMDSNDIERERGITILAKNTAIDYKDHRINILDTPGHADFSGEVERIMNMVDGVLLVVDAYEGTMPQTRFVLKKALEQKLTPIVVVNKIDRPAARPEEVVDEVLELFIDLGAEEDQLDFPVVYASALNQTASMSDRIEDQEDNMSAVFETILSEIPSPVMDAEAALQFQPALLDYNDYVGRIGIGRVARGTIKVNEMVSICRLDGSVKQFRITKLFGFLGLNRIEVEEAVAGDIVAVSGLANINVGETICEVGKEDPLEPLRVDEPTLKMTFSTNSSPFVGQEGKLVTASKIDERLSRETQRDVSLLVERVGTKEEWVVSGRGELHLGILLENMRREGFELEVSKPEVIIREINGVLCEPYEDVQIEVPEESSGAVIEALGHRKGQMQNMIHNESNQVRLLYTAPSRALIGFMTEFLTLTKGYGILNHTFLDYRPMETGSVGERKNGALVSMENGKATNYSLTALDDRGVMFIEPGAAVYEGMIIGENNKEQDLAVNVSKAKQLTNHRSAGKDNTVVLKRPRQITLEYALEYIAEDELVEITPGSIRLRKKILDTNARKKQDKMKKWNLMNGSE
ncbi:MAG: translational GTPase TypA [Turicibacter sp.]|nr:translational GTPase TypA [Turicibacter sp.]